MRETRLLEFRSVSEKWHRFLAGTTHAAATAKATESSLPKASVHSTRAVARTVPGCIVEVANVPAPEYTAELLPSTFVTCRSSDRSLELLGTLYGESSQFRSPEQRAAVDNTLHTANDVVAILPTGTGKSLLFFLYAYANRHRLITSLVVVPMHRVVEARSSEARRGARNPLFGHPHCRYLCKTRVLDTRGCGCRSHKRHNS